MRLDFRDERGQSAVEFAMILPLFITFLTVLIYVGVAYNGWIDETHLASTAARYVAVGNEEPGGPGSGSCETKQTRPGECLEKWTQEQGDQTFVKEATTEICKPGAAGKLAVGEPVEVRLKFMYKWAPLFSIESEAVSKAVMRVEAVPRSGFTYAKCPA